MNNGTTNLFYKDEDIIPLFHTSEELEHIGDADTNHDAKLLQYNPHDIYPFCDKSGKFIDFVLNKPGVAIITDYEYIEREIVIKDGGISFGKEKMKNKIETIDEFKKIIEKLTLEVFAANYNFTKDVIRIDKSFIDFLNKNFDYNINNYDSEFPASHKLELKEAMYLFTVQIIIDILYEKYIIDSPDITLVDYRDKYIRYDWVKLMEEIIEEKINEIIETKKSKATEDHKIDSKMTKKISDSEKSAILSFHECLRAVLPKYTRFADSDNISHIIKRIPEEFKKLKPCHINCSERKECLFKCNDLLKDYINDLENKLEKKKDARYKAISVLIKDENEWLNTPNNKYDTRKYGFDPGLYNRFISKLNKGGKSVETKPKVLWDYEYYDSNPELITYKQNEQKLRKDTNITYQDFINDFKYYDSFVEALLPKKTDKGKDYFCKSMDFYHLERYKKLDYNYKLAVRMDSIGMTGIDKENYFVKNFQPCVYLPLMDEDKNRLGACRA